MSYSHLQTATGQPIAVAAAGSSHFRQQRHEPTATAGAVSGDTDITGWSVAMPRSLILVVARVPMPPGKSWKVLEKYP